MKVLSSLFAHPTILLGLYRYRYYINLQSGKWNDLRKNPFFFFQLETFFVSNLNSIIHPFMSTNNNALLATDLSSSYGIKQKPNKFSIFNSGPFIGSEKSFERYFSKIDIQSYTSNSYTKSDDLFDLPINENIVRSLDEIGVHKLFPIQKKGFRPVLDGENALLYAQTGTGKTLAYLIPLIQRIHNEQMSFMHSVIIVVPTRELCKQIGSVIMSLQTYSHHTLKVILLYGGGHVNEGEHILKTPTQYQQSYSNYVKKRPKYGENKYLSDNKGIYQEERDDITEVLMKEGAHIIVGTPGKLLYYIEKGVVNTRNIRVCVFEEADTLLFSVGGGLIGGKLSPLLAYLLPNLLHTKAKPHITQQTNTLNTHTSNAQQILLVTASLPHKLTQWIHTNIPNTHFIHNLQGGEKNMFRPSENINTHIDHRICKVSKHGRLQALVHFISTLVPPQQAKAIIFASSHNEAEEIRKNPYLNKRSCLSHSQMSVDERDKALLSMTEGEADILICTDLLSRGLDLANITHVFQYHPPENPNDYLHRAGRTGRGLNKGQSITFYDISEYKLIKKIGVHTQHPLKQIPLPNKQDFKNLHQKQLLNDLLSVSEEEYGQYIERAKKLHIDSGGEALSVALSILDGRYLHTHPHTQTSTRSQFTGKIGYEPLLIHRPYNTFEQDIKSSILQFLQIKLPSISLKAIGRIGKTPTGVIVDLPIYVTQNILTSNDPYIDGILISPIHQMPPLNLDVHTKPSLRANKELPWSRFKKTSNRRNSTIHFGNKRA